VEGSSPEQVRSTARGDLDALEKAGTGGSQGLDYQEFGMFNRRPWMAAALHGQTSVISCLPGVRMVQAPHRSRVAVWSEFSR
jgi:hypothetical protein